MDHVVDQILPFAQIVSEEGTDAQQEGGHFDDPAHRLSRTEDFVDGGQQFEELCIVASESLAAHHSQKDVDDGHVEDGLDVDNSARMRTGLSVDVGHQLNDLVAHHDLLGSAAETKVFQVAEGETPLFPPHFSFSEDDTCVDGISMKPSSKSLISRFPRICCGQLDENDEIEQFCDLITGN